MGVLARLLARLPIDVPSYLDDGRLLRDRVEGVVEDGLPDNVEGDGAEERLHVHRRLRLALCLQLVDQHLLLGGVGGFGLSLIVEYSLVCGWVGEWTNIRLQLVDQHLSSGLGG